MKNFSNLSVYKFLKNGAKNFRLIFLVEICLFCYFKEMIQNNVTHRSERSPKRASLDFSFFVVF